MVASALPQPSADNGNSSSHNDSEAALRQAISWLVHMQAQPGNETVAQACMAWRQACPANEAAWADIQSSYGMLQQTVARLPSGSETAASQAINQVAAKNGRRRALGRLAACLIVAAPAGWLAERTLPWQRIQADYATATGERREITLPDGTQLQLNTDTAVRMRFDDSQRLLLLDRGEIFVSSGHDPLRTLHRPLRVQTAQGLFEALGTRFTVQLLPQANPAASRLSVEEGAVRMQPRSGMAVPDVAQAGQSFIMTDTGTQAETARGMDPYAWTDGLLVVKDMRLADFLAELGRYRVGYLGWDKSVADLRISGTYPLDDTSRTLALLTEVLPVEVAWTTRYWTRVRPASKAR